jgi:hypothetical protein
VPDRLPILADVTAPETAVFALSEEIARGETLFDTGAERFEGRSEENSYAGWRFHCYSWAELTRFRSTFRAAQPTAPLGGTRVATAPRVGRQPCLSSTTWTEPS